MKAVTRWKEKKGLGGITIVVAEEEIVTMWYIIIKNERGIKSKFRRSLTACRLA